MIQVARLHKLSGDKVGKVVKAFADIRTDLLIVKGLRIVQGKEKLFVAMPREQGKDGKWYDIVFPANKEAKVVIEEAVLQAYNEA